MHHVRKYTKLRWDCGGIEIVVSEVESLEMGKRENGAIGMEETFKATTTEVNSNDVTCHHITGDPIPPTTNLYPFSTNSSEDKNNNHTYNKKDWQKKSFWNGTKQSFSLKGKET